MVHLVVGFGEVGKALYSILGKGNYWMDSSSTNWHGEEIDVIHICIPYNKEFNEWIKYWKSYRALVIVHSSVPVETCDKLGVVHSPIRGVHPKLEKGIRTFIKYFGGKDAKKAAKIFGKLGIRTKVYKEARITEAIKLWDTTQYGRLIMLEKEIYKWCKKHKIDFNAVYTQANMDYNTGYERLGRHEVVRPYLKHVEGPIGGHCVRENSKLLGVKL